MPDAVLTQPQLEAWLGEWQAILRLQDWRVAITTRRAWQMSAKDSFGTTETCRAKKRATIQVQDSLDESHEPNDAWIPCDPEKTVVHELLHLHFDAFFDHNEGPVQTAQEQAIDLIAEALVNLKRSTEG